MKSSQKIAVERTAGLPGSQRNFWIVRIPIYITMIIPDVLGGGGRSSR